MRKGVNFRLSDEELAALDARARGLGLNRTELVRTLGTGSVGVAHLDEGDLVNLLERQARNGHVRACEILLKRLAKPAEAVPPPRSPLAGIVDELSHRRAG